MDMLQAAVIAILQGATELFPVSSLGHAVVLPAILRWNIDQNAPAFLPFLVMLHVGTAVALFGYFWRDWLTLITGVLGVSGTQQNRESRRVFLLIVIATIPAVVVGFALEHALRRLFGSPVLVAGFLVANGLMLLFGERLRSRGGNREMASLNYVDALVIGVWQCLALLPGLSRSGATMVGALLRGIDHEASAHFSFLIATPIIIGATVLEVPKLLHENIPPGTLQLSLIAAVIAGITALASTAFLMRYFRVNDKMALNPFAYYCVAFGVLCIVLLAAT